MKTPYFYTALLIALVFTVEPTTSALDEIILVTDDFFSDDLIIYRGEYDVVDILYPLNALNEELLAKKDIYFFTLADLTELNRTVYKGLFVSKKGVVRKLLDNGRVSTYSKDSTREVYFAATDGLYSYNADTNKAEKYGTITDSLITAVKVKGEDTLYVLTENRILYKVTERGTKKEKIDHAPNMEDIVMDNRNNLYFSTQDKKVHIVGRDGVRQVQGLPQHINYLKIYKAPFFVDDAIALIANTMSHLIFVNGTVGVGHCEYYVKPTAYSLQPLLLQQYGYKKNIYQLDFLNIKKRVTHRGQLKSLLKRKVGNVLKYLGWLRRHTGA